VPIIRRTHPTRYPKPTPLPPIPAEEQEELAPSNTPSPSTYLLIDMCQLKSKWWRPKRPLPYEAAPVVSIRDHDGSLRSLTAAEIHRLHVTMKPPSKLFKYQYPTASYYPQDGPYAQFTFEQFNQKSRYDKRVQRALQEDQNARAHLEQLKQEKAKAPS